MIRKFSNKAFKPGDIVTNEAKSAIIETKEIEFCYPTLGVTIKAKNKEEADEKAKKFIS